jgi:hypothetical protein
MAVYDSIGIQSSAAVASQVSGTLANGSPPQGSIIIAVYACGGNGTGVYTCSSFPFSATPVGLLTMPGGNAEKLYAGYRIAGASEPSSYTFATGSSSNYISITIYVLTGRNVASLFTTSSSVTAAGTTSPVSIAIPTMTAAAGDDMLWIGSTTELGLVMTFNVPSGLGFATTGNAYVNNTGGTSGNQPSIGTTVSANFAGGATGTMTGTEAWTGGGTAGGLAGIALSITKAPIMSNIVQQTGVWSFGDTITCPAFGSAVTAGDAIALVAYLFPVALAISSSPVVSDGTANVYKLATIFMQPTHTWPITFTASPTGTAGTLNANFAGATGTTCTIVFSDGEIRRASVTNGNTAVTWTTAISGTPTVNAIAYDNIACMAMWLAQNSVAGTVTPQFVTTLGGTQALYAAEITNVGTGNILLGTSGNIQFGPGTSPNAINSGSVAVSQTGVLFGFCFDQSTITTVAIAGGTGFVAQSAVWNSGTVVCAMAEDATINTSTAATFTALTAGTHGSDTFYSLAMALAGPGPFTPFTQTQFFVTDTIVQQ